MNSYSLKKILIPIDLSETSLNALNTAVFIAAKNNAALQILHVNERVFGQPVNGHKAFHAEKINKDVLTALTGSIQSINEINPVLLQKEGHIMESIITTAADEKSDLIIMGTHGASGSRQGFIGSNTYGVIKHAACPVLTIPSGKKFKEFRTVLFPIRAVTGALSAYQVSCHLMSPGSKLQILGLSNLKVNRETSLLDKIVEEIKERLEADMITTNTYWATGTTMPDIVLQFAEKNTSDLIVLTPSFDTTIKTNYIGIYRQQVINSSRLPVLNI